MHLDPVEAYEAFDSWSGCLFPLSARVDVALFLISLKPCLRTQIQRRDETALKKWCTTYDFLWKIDSEGFLYIASDSKLLGELIELDHSDKRHEEIFGGLLGYPSCCCKKIAEVGEENIDTFEEELCKEPFIGPYKMINPKNYRQGRALISHVPCSRICEESLEIAKAFCVFLQSQQSRPVFRDWLWAVVREVL